MVGQALVAGLPRMGHQVIEISRRAPACSVRWDPARQRLDLDALQGIDAVVHLAGENLAKGRWSEARKRELRDSRVSVTRWLATALAELDPPPSCMVSASAIGVYGDRGDEVLDEQTHPGTDYLARLCVDWEAAADPARQAGIRVVHPRFGMILSPQGGALARLLPPFRLGVGGRLGSGRQWISWIAITDVVHGIDHLLRTTSLDGAVNFTAPAPLRNAEFAATLAAGVHRPALLPVPGLALRLAFGEMADATLLASQRAIPVRLQASGYDFRHPELRGALNALLAPRE